MTDHEQVLRNYVNSVNAVAALFGPSFSERVSFDEFKVAMQKEILSTAAYVASLKEQGFNPPAGLESRNNEQAKLYFPHGMVPV